jgi:hypothetical protein
MSADQPGLSALEAWVYEHVADEVIKDLFKGTIAISHSGILGTRWNVAYEFEHDEALFTWHIHSSIPNLTSVIAPREWRSENGLPLRETLYQRLTGQDQPTGGQLVPPTIPFSLESLLPRPHPHAAEGLSMVGVEMEPLNANVPPSPHRAFMQAFGIAPSAVPPPELVQRSHNLSSVLSPILDRGLWYLGVAGASLEMPSGGMGLPGSSDRQLNSPVPRSDIWMLPMRLNVFKNGRQVDQARYQAIQEMFRELAPVIASKCDPRCAERERISRSQSLRLKYSQVTQRLHHQPGLGRCDLQARELNRP